MTMSVSSRLTIIGVRHHSPACARLVEQVITESRPAFVLIEGPSDFNDKLDELWLRHTTPIAIFTSFAPDSRLMLRSWAPLCDYSPEWVALQRGHRVGADVRFIDLPAWDKAMSGYENRYADADAHYRVGIERLCEECGVDNQDALWDHLIELPNPTGLQERLETYFEGLRGDAQADEADTAREEYMARWIRAALDQTAGNVVVVCGGFHRPALLRLVGVQESVNEDRTSSVTSHDSLQAWPEVPPPPHDAIGVPVRSYLVPYSFRRLDAFSGYQSGMPSPAFYQDVWDSGPDQAAENLTATVVARLRERQIAVSTADLIVARTTSDGLATLRGHEHKGRVDVLDGLASALITEAQDVPFPWSRRGSLAQGTDPVVVEMIAACSGSRVGKLAAATPLPPLVAAVSATIAEHHLDRQRNLSLDLLEQRPTSQVLHQLRVLDVPDIERVSGPGFDHLDVMTEAWHLPDLTEPLPDSVLVALIEAGGYGPTLHDAATARLEDRATRADLAETARILMDAVLCGADTVSTSLSHLLSIGIGEAKDANLVGQVLATTLTLWRYGRAYGVEDNDDLKRLVAEGHARLSWLLEAVRGSGPADQGRIRAFTAWRDAALYAVGAADTVVIARRIATAVGVPPDVQGAALGTVVTLDESSPPDLVRAMRGMSRPETLGDWLAGLLALARDCIDPLLDDLDATVAAFDDESFLVALPALRQAFAYLPPREREGVAESLLSRRGLTADVRSFLHIDGNPVLMAEGIDLDARVSAALDRWGLDDHQDRAEKEADDG